MAGEKKRYTKPIEIDDSIMPADAILRDPAIASKLGTGEIEDWGGGVTVTDSFGDEYNIRAGGAKKTAYGL